MKSMYVLCGFVCTLTACGLVTSVGHSGYWVVPIRNDTDKPLHVHLVTVSDFSAPCVRQQVVIDALEEVALFLPREDGGGKGATYEEFLALYAYHDWRYDPQVVLRFVSTEGLVQSGSTSLPETALDYIIINSDSFSSREIMVLVHALNLEDDALVE